MINDIQCLKLEVVAAVLLLFFVSNAMSYPVYFVAATPDGCKLRIPFEEVSLDPKTGNLLTNIVAGRNPQLICGNKTQDIAKVDAPPTPNQSQTSDVPPTVAQPAQDPAGLNQQLDFARDGVSNLESLLTEKKELVDSTRRLVENSNSLSSYANGENQIAQVWTKISYLDGRFDDALMTLDKRGQLSVDLRSRIADIKQRNAALGRQVIEMMKKVKDAKGAAQAAEKAKAATEEERSILAAWFVSGTIAASVMLIGAALGLFAVFFVRRAALSRQTSINSSEPTSDDIQWNRLRIEENRLLAKMTRFVPFILVCIALISAFFVLIFVLTERSSIIDPVKGGTLFGTLGAVFVFFVGTAKWHAGLESTLREAIKLDKELGAAQA